MQQRRLRIRIVTPAPPGSRYGNRTTALRWGGILRSLGHAVRVDEHYRGESCDLLVALHARKSAPSVESFKRRHPEATVALCLTGTDVYGDIRGEGEAQRSLELASRLVALQPRARDELEPHFQEKVRVVLQSARPVPGGRVPRNEGFDVCVVGHLRPVKDPFRAAMAGRLAPASSRLQVLHIGGGREPEMEEQARQETATNRRYRWLGEVSRSRTRRRMCRSRAVVVSSRSEGGANVVSEALADSIPVIASRIPGNTGLLGDDYPGYFEVGDTAGLAELLYRAEFEPGFLAGLERWCAQLSPAFRPEAERVAWRDLLQELGYDAVPSGSPASP